MTADANPASPHAISFDIASGPLVISPDTPLPEITAPVVIDGTTQPGAENGAIVQLDGGKLGPGAGNPENGLVVSAGGSTIKGLVIERFPGSGIVLKSKGGNLIASNTIGTDAQGDANLGNLKDGITIDGSANNTIGGQATGAGNLISGNVLAGLRITGGSASGNVIEGNKIGTNPAGTAAVPNRYDGVLVDGAPGNTIGGIVPFARNLISGNHFAGARLTGSGASGNVIEGNYVGTDAQGAHPLGNNFDGVFIDNAARNTIGGTSPTAGNLIAANGSVGVQIGGSGASANQVLGNFIGTDAAGRHPLGNVLDGVFISNAPTNTVGGAGAGAGNLISSNGSSGVQLFGAGSSGEVVQGNLIGTDVFAHPVLGNLYGLFENGEPASATVGGTGAAKNTVAGNRRANVFLGDGQSNQGITLPGINPTQAPGVSKAANAPAGKAANASQAPNPPQAQSGPIVTSSSTTASGSLVTAVVLQVRTPLDPSRADDLTNYRLQLPNSGGGFATTGGGTIPLRSAVYDSSARTVTLSLETPVSTNLMFQVLVSGLTDPSVHGAGASPADGHQVLVFGRVAPGHTAARGDQNS